MSEISSLSLKIPQDLKDQIKAAAAENQVSLSAEVCARLLKTFASDEQPAQVDLVDNQNTEELVEQEQPLTTKEIKKLRQLLKSKKK